MVYREDVEMILDLIRPNLQADGGDVELVDISEDGIVMVELRGHCADCPMSQITLSQGIERVLKENIPGIKSVIPADLANMIELGE